MNGEVVLEKEGGQEQEKGIIGCLEPDFGIEEVIIKYVTINLLKLFNILAFFCRYA